MSLRILILNALMFLAVFLPLWLSSATGPGWAALYAAIPSALAKALQMYGARR